MDTYELRRPRVEDAPEIFELASACTVESIGFADVTLDDIADELVEPGFDRERDGWLAWRDGTLVAWAWACRKGDSDNVDIEVLVRPGTPDDLAPRLWELVLGRAREIAAELGHDSVTTDIGVYRPDTAQRDMAARHGFAPATSFHRMRIDFTGPVEAPELPAGLTLHRGESEEVLREAHGVQQEAFAEHFGFVKTSFEEWFARRDASASTDWSQALLARIDGEPAALVIGTDQFAEDEDCGYVLTLAVRPAYRGRGLGRFLLRTAFAEDYARGRKGTLLHVDSNNTTPALGLYTSAGMRPVLVIDVWRLNLKVRT
ncbi:MAG: GNAT family N-acetyltransferase [Thermoactinospora sp.]|nr:GNAT family N-acetyltransferase [Thermoactinospora sp.]